MFTDEPVVDLARDEDESQPAPVEKTTRAEAHLGWRGVRLGSKTVYRGRWPSHVVVFNATVCVRDGKVWDGDLDLTDTEPQLRELARALGEDVYVIRESDWFDNARASLLDQAVLVAHSDGTSTIGRDNVDEWERDAAGALRNSPDETLLNREAAMTLLGWLPEDD